MYTITIYERHPTPEGKKTFRTFLRCTKWKQVIDELEHVSMSTRYKIELI